MHHTDEYALDDSCYDDTVTPDNAGKRFVVDFKNRASRLYSFLFTLFLVFLGIYTILHYGVIERVFDENADPRVIIGVFGFMAAVFLFDILWLLYAMMTGKPAIEMDERGIRGYHGGLWRDIVWDEVGYIYYRVNQLIIVRKPHTNYHRFMHRHSTVGGRSRPEQCIVVPLKHVTATDHEILTQIDRFYPEAGEHVFAMVRSWFKVGTVNS